MDIIENKKYKKKVEIKDVLIPILLVLACLFIPVFLIILAALLSSDNWSIFVCIAIILFVWATTALVLYIKEKKCFKLIKSLVVEVLYGFALFCSVVGEGDNMWKWKIWLFFAVLYLAFGFYRTFKLWFEWKLNNNKWYNKWWFRMIVVIVAGLLLWLLAAFLTGYCNGRNWLFCNQFTWVMGNLSN